MVETARTAETLWDALNREEVELASGESWEEVVSSTMHFVDLAYRAGGDEAQVSLHARLVDWIIQQWAYVDCKNSRLAAEIAALQGRAFEDGAREGLSDALAAYDETERERATASAVYDEVSKLMGGHPDIGEIMDCVGAEGACIRASLAADLARSKLIETLRTALQPEGERNA